MAQGHAWQAVAPGQVWPITCVCTAKNGVYISKGCKQTERRKCLMTSENRTKFNFQCLQIKFYWNAARLICRILAAAACTLGQQNRGATQTVGPEKPKMLTIWPFAVNVCRPLANSTKAGPDMLAQGPVPLLTCSVTLSELLNPTVP